MTLFQIAFKNISRDKHTYFSYFISSAVTIMIFYLFTAAAFHPDLNEIQNGSTLALALAAGNFIIYGFSFLFIGYSSWAFLGSRGKQLGIYTILGMSPKQMKKMLFGENMVIGMTALAVGLISGILFSGLFFKLIRNIFVTISFDIYFPIIPILITMLLFIVLFLIIGLFIPRFISHKKVLWFLKSDKSYAKNIQISKWSILLSILVLGVTIVVIIPNVGNLLGDLWTYVVFLCVICLIFLTTPQICAIYSAIKKHSKNHLKGIHLFADSEVSTAAKENRHMMSLNAVLLTMSFLAICALGSMQSNVIQDVETIAPFAYMYIERPNNTHAEKDIRFLDNELLKDENIQKIQYEILRKQFTYGFIKESDFNKILTAKGKQTIDLAKDEVVILPGSSDMKLSSLSLLPEVTDIFNKNSLNITHINTINQIVSISGGFKQIYVIKDENWTQINHQKQDELYIESFIAYHDNNWLNHLAISEKLEHVLEHDDNDYDYTYAFITLGNYYDTELLMRKLCTFVGFSISLLFLIASISIIYFRLYTTLERERKKYNSMYKLGFSTKEMYQTLSKKIKLLLWVPFSVAIFVMWIGILYIDSQSLVSSLRMSLNYSVIFIILYFVFYQFVIRIYRNKFTEKQ